MGEPIAGIGRRDGVEDPGESIEKIIMGAGFGCA